jgi:hypothetical protein
LKKFRRVLDPSDPEDNELIQKIQFHCFPNESIDEHSIELDIPKEEYYYINVLYDHEKFKREYQRIVSTFWS